MAVAAPVAGPVAAPVVAPALTAAGNGLTVADSDANFVLFGVFADRDAVWQGLLDHGVLIRNTGPEGWLRVTVGTPAENDAFKHALTEVHPR